MGTKKDEFLKQIVCIDTETTNLYPEQAEIVEVASAKYVNQTWQVESTLLGAVNGIPPEASAKNNISNKMIAGLPTFSQSVDKVKAILNWKRAEYFVAHNCQYDQKVLEASFNKEELTVDAGISKSNERWICTYRLAKKLLDIDFSDMQYNLNYLRYKLDLPVPDTTTAHRAADDTLTCALLFEFLVDYAIAKNLIDETKEVGPQVHQLCWGAFPVTVWPFGKYKGKQFSDIPTDYYLWAVDNLDRLKDTHADYDRDLTEAVRKELENRLS